MTLEQATSRFMHYSTFDRKVGQQEYRSRMNEFLSVYGSGYELSQQGEILIAARERELVARKLSPGSKN